jgi:hypothetical protein
VLVLVFVLVHCSLHVRARALQSALEKMHRRFVTGDETGEAAGDRRGLVVWWNEPVERRRPSPPLRIVQRYVTKPPREEHLSRMSTNTWWSSRRLRSTSRAALW